MRDQSVWFPTSLTQQGIEWAETTPEQLSDTAFLFGTFATGARRNVRPVGDVSLAGAVGDARPARYIFHTAFCCSTLLARSLDIPGKNLSLKEPDILMQIANLERNHAGRANLLVPMTQTGMFAVGQKAGEAVTVKLTNAANRIVPQLMAPNHARAIIIHSDLESFLLSIARKGEEGRTFVRRLYNIISMDTPFAQSLAPRDVFTLTDMQIAGFVWAMQCAQLNAAQAVAPDKYRTLHCDAFLSRPGTTIEAASRFLALGLNEDDIETIMASGVFDRNSKEPGQAFDAQVRSDERGQAESMYSEAVSFVREWVRKLPLPSEISGRPLLT